MLLRNMRSTRGVTIRKHGLHVALTVLAFALPLQAGAQKAAEPVEHPLDPPDLSSPESTLNTFLFETVQALDAYHAGDVEEMELHAGRTFQTMEMPLPADDAAFLRAAEATLYLFEILSRVPLPRPRQIPGPSVAFENMPRYWTIPHTELVLSRFDSESGEPLGYRSVFAPCGYEGSTAPSSPFLTRTFHSSQLVNFSRRDMNLFLAKLQLRLETSPDQLRLHCQAVPSPVVRRPLPA